MQPPAAPPDPVTTALEDALAAWRSGRDPRALRRALARLLLELETP